MSLNIYSTRESAEYWSQCEQAMQQVPPNVVGLSWHRAAGRGAGDPDIVCPLFFPTLGENFGHVILESLLTGCTVPISDRTPWNRLEERRAGRPLSLEQPESFVAALGEFAPIDDAGIQEWSTGAARLGRECNLDAGMRREARTVLESAMQGT